MKKKKSLPKRGTASSVKSIAACKVAIVGFGTVGSSVARILSERSLPGVQITHICNRNVTRKKVAWLSEDVIWTDDFNDVLKSDANIVVEVIGGQKPAGEWISKALSAGKSVVTANKQVISRRGPEFEKLAKIGRAHV